MFDFVKDAGAKIGIGESRSEEEAKAAAAAAAKQADVQHAAEEQAAKVAAQVKARKAAADQAARAESLAEAKKSAALEHYVLDLGLAVTNLDVRFDDGLATVTGQVADQDTRERIILAIGNSAGVERVSEELTVVAPAAAPAPEAVAAPPAPPEPQMHVVVKGETLSKIAKEYYGDAMKYPAIFEANKPMLTDPDKIYVGQVLRIPAL
ncbi:MAG: peptidoglycan-binding protein LysM [Acidimicrobiales bacterium]